MESQAYSEVWIEQARRGSQAAFARLVRHWHPRIYNFAYKYFADHDTAAEVTQQTFITVHQKLAELRSTEYFRHWLYRIAANECHQENRRQKRSRVFSFSFWQRDEPGPTPDQWAAEPDTEAEKNEITERLLKALNQLPPEQRVVVIMKEYEGLKFREIAAALDVSESTVKSRMYYGLENLRKTLEKWNVTKDKIFF